MGYGRKYILNVQNSRSCGLSSSQSLSQYNLLDKFSGSTNQGTICSFSYSAITTSQLSTLSIENYNNRVFDFLNYVNINSISGRTSLLQQSIFTDPDCPSFSCKLNSNFLVYIFLDGFRIVNIGDVNGIAEYRVTILGQTPQNSWTTSPTFLGLDHGKRYVVEVRDNYNSEIVCAVSQIITYWTLVPSTTIAPTTAAPTTATPTTQQPTTQSPSVKKTISWNSPKEILQNTAVSSYSSTLNIYPALSAGDSVTLKFGTNTCLSVSSGTLGKNMTANSCVLNSNITLSTVSSSLIAPAFSGAIDNNSNTSNNIVITLNNINNIIACVSTNGSTNDPTAVSFARAASANFQIISYSGGNTFITDDPSLNLFCVTNKVVSPILPS